MELERSVPELRRVVAQGGCREAVATTKDETSGVLGDRVEVRSVSTVVHKLVYNGLFTRYTGPRGRSEARARVVGE